MSVRTMARVWAGSKHGGSHLLLLLAIADFSDDDGNAYPAVSTLADKCRMKLRNAQVILAALRKSGELAVRENEGPKGTNLYRITITDGVQGLAGVQSLAGVQGNARGGVKACAKPLQRLAPEPSLNHQEPPSIGRSTGKPKLTGKAEHPLFAEFYAAYPRKAARPAALKAFTAIDPKPDTLRAMLAAIRAQGLADRCDAGEDRFVPYPATWLNGRRWEDQTAAPHAAPSQTPRRPVLHADDVFEAAR